MQAFLQKSIDFLLDRSSPALQYRLHRDILRDLSPAREEALLAQVLDMPLARLLLAYQKENGYIGIGMHSWDKFKETPLQDGEAAARLIARYGLPRTLPVVQRFASALGDDGVLQNEFSYYGPERKRFALRDVGTQSGFSLRLLTDTCLALIGCGDDGTIAQTMQISLDAVTSLLSLTRLSDITRYDPNARRRYNYPYIQADTSFPCMYHLQLLAHTRSWRTPKALAQVAVAIDHHGTVFQTEENLHVKIGSAYYVPLWSLTRPIRPFEQNNRKTCCRRVLTDLARLGIGKRMAVTRASAERVADALLSDGSLRMAFDSARAKRAYLQSLAWPTPYSEVGLARDYASDESLWCDLTFWAVEFLHYYEQSA